MPSTASALTEVAADIGYISPALERAEVRVYPISSGLPTVQPETYPVRMIR